MRRYTACMAVTASMACLLALAGCSSASGQTETEAPAEEAQEPVVATQTVQQTNGSLGTFSAVTLEGESFTSDDVAGKDVTVINFWQTTCPPCIAEMPDLAALARLLPDNVQIVTFCFDGSSKTETAVDVVGRSGWEGATLVEADGGLLELCYRVQYTPTTIFVASDGTIVGNFLVGTSAELEAAYLKRINEVLAWEGKPSIALADEPSVA